MTLVIVETLANVLLEPEKLDDAHRQTLDCLAARHCKWRYSLLSSDRQRMICTFEAPDAESVRESYRRGGTFFSCIWAGEKITPEGIPPLPNESTLKVLEGTYPDGFTWDQWDEANAYVLPCYAERHAEWVQSYVSSDRTRTICEINAPDAEVIREANRRFGIPFDRVWSATLIKP